MTALTGVIGGEPRIGVLGRGARQHSTVARCTMPPSSTPPSSQSSQRIMGSALLDDGGHRRFAPGACRDADRGIVEPQHQHIAVDAAGRQPVAGPRARADRDLEAAVGVAHDLLAGEAVAADGIGDELPVRIVERERPEARRRRDAAQRPRRSGRRARRPASSAARIEGDAVARADRQFAAARDHARAHRDRCRACRCFGQAVQAPMVTPPKAMPRVSANQVAPRPTTAAIDQREQRSEKQPHGRSAIERCNSSEDYAACRRDGSVPLGGAGPLEDAATNASARSTATSRRLLRRRRCRSCRAASARVASSISRSSLTRISVPRRVSTGAARCRLAAAGRPGATSGARCRRRRRAEPWNVLQLDALMRIGHDLAARSSPAASRRSCGWSARNRRCRTRRRRRNCR